MQRLDYLPTTVQRRSAHDGAAALLPATTPRIRVSRHLLRLAPETFTSMHFHPRGLKPRFLEMAT
eukprot:scaffold21580_cov65-Phaeocystis_antarctica.AAC.3